MFGHDDWIESVPAVSENGQRQGTKLRFEGLVTEIVALGRGLRHLISVDLFGRRFGGPATVEMSIHFKASMKRLEKERTAS